MDPLEEMLMEKRRSAGADPLEALVAEKRAAASPAPAALPSDSLEIPRGLTPEQVQYLSKGPTAQDFSGNQVPVKDLGWAAQAGHGMANAIERTGLGATQMVNDALVGGKRLFGLDTNGPYPIGTEDKAAELKGEALDMRRRQAPIENTTAGMLGGLAPSLMVPGSSITKAIAGGAALGALEPETGQLEKNGSITRGMQDVIGERATNAIQGGGMFGLGNVAGKAIGGIANRLPFVGSPARGGAAATEQDALRASEVKDAEDLGMQVDVSGRTGGRFSKGLRAVFRDVPVTSGVQKRFDEGNVSRANQVLAQQFGSDAKVLSEDVIKEAKARVGPKFQEYRQANVPINYDGRFMIAMKNMKREVDLLPESRRSPQLQSIVKDLYDDILPSWKAGKVSIDGERYAALRSDLSEEARRSYRESPNTARQINQVVEALDDMAGRSVPKENQEAFKEARKQWQAIKIAEGSVDESGNIVRTKLKTATKAALPNAGDGQDIYRKLNRAIKVTSEDVPNSGTPLRALAIASLGAPSLAISGIPGITPDSGPLDWAKGLALPLATQAAMLNPYTARLITRQLGPRQLSITKALQRAGGLGAYGAMQQSQQ